MSTKAYLTSSARTTTKARSEGKVVAQAPRAAFLEHLFEQKAHLVNPLNLSQYVFKYIK